MKKLFLIAATISITTLSFGQKIVKELNEEQKIKCSKSIESALKYAEQDYPEAMYLLGLSISKLEPTDTKHAVYWKQFDSNNPNQASAFWLQKSCDAGWIDACQLYAYYAYTGKTDNDRNTKKAILYSEKALQLDTNNFKTSYLLSAYYMLNGDILNAEKYFNKTLKHPNRDWDLESMILTTNFIQTWGLAYLQGIGVKQNDQKAYSLFQQLAARVYHLHVNYEIPLTQSVYYYFYLADKKLGCTPIQCWSEQTKAIFNDYAELIKYENQDPIHILKKGYELQGLDINNEEVQNNLIKDYFVRQAQNNLERHAKIKSFEELCTLTGLLTSLY